MVIKEILQQLENSTHPVARALHKGEHFKVIAIAFKSGMLLHEHQAILPSKLTVLKGSVVYKEGEKEITLNEYDETEIPAKITHNVAALDDSLCLLTQG
ncbi:MAG: hypothetical protein WAT19_06260 [Ferruginibacter sp.]